MQYEFDCLSNGLRLFRGELEKRKKKEIDIYTTA